jgi:hypothetical protein
LVKQVEVNPTMRRTLTNWLFEVAESNEIQSSTVCLAVHFLDCALRVILIERRTFQLWGSVCLLTAAKLEEVEVSRC